MINNPPVPTRRVELALRAPLTESEALTVLEAVDNSPPVRVERALLVRLPVIIRLLIFACVIVLLAAVVVAKVVVAENVLRPVKV